MPIEIETRKQQKRNTPLPLWHEVIANKHYRQEKEQELVTIKEH
jgi:hypothetical protein